MFWRCLNNIFSYCNGEPKFGEVGQCKDGWSNRFYLTCQLNPKTCHKRVSLIGSMRLALGAKPKQRRKDGTKGLETRELG